jgi:hypothetical protein
MRVGRSGDNRMNSRGLMGGPRAHNRCKLYCRPAVQSFPET